MSWSVMCETHEHIFEMAIRADIGSWLRECFPNPSGRLTHKGHPTVKKQAPDESAALWNSSRKSEGTSICELSLPVSREWICLIILNLNFHLCVERTHILLCRSFWTLYLIWKCLRCNLWKSKKKKSIYYALVTFRHFLIITFLFAGIRMDKKSAQWGADG